MKVTEHLQNAEEKPIFSFEILPPLKGQTFTHLVSNIEPILAHNPSFVNVTYHREEVTYQELPNGFLQKNIVRKRPGTVGICAAIQNRFNIDAIPHVLCGGFNQEDTENLLIDLNFIGIDNLMALRGDPVLHQIYFKANHMGHSYAGELVNQISQLNKGHHLNDLEKTTFKTDFCIGVAGYPEKHQEAPSLTSDIQKLKWKVNQGADFVITQMFYDNQKYWNFVQECRNQGITVPIIPGIKPFTSISQLSMIPQRFHLDLPQKLINLIENCKTNLDAKKVGIEWAIQQCIDLKHNGAPCLHFYTMGNGESTQSILKEIGF